jgi:hypothetical protein
VTLSTFPEVHRFIAMQLDRKFEPYAKMPIALPYVRNGRTEIEADGSMAEGFAVPFELYPPAVQALCDAAEEMLLKNVERFVRLLRWQQNLDGPHWVFDVTPALYWNINASTYRIVGFRVQQGTSKSPAGIEWRDDDRADLEALFSDKTAEESIAHELLREAKLLEANSPRSSFLVATAALEIGVKLYVSHLAPDTSWLLSELPSPPIPKILRTYIPELHQKNGRPLNYWEKLKPVFKRIETHASTRNKLVHTGSIKIKAQDLSSYLQDVSDLLFLFDVLRGYEWARHNVSHQMRTSLAWPSSRRTRYTVVMRSGGL